MSHGAWREEKARALSRAAAHRIPHPPPPPRRPSLTSRPRRLLFLEIRGRGALSYTSTHVGLGCPCSFICSDVLLYTVLYDEPMSREEKHFVRVR